MPKKWQTVVFGLTCTADKWTSGLKIKLLWKHEVQLQLRVHRRLKTQFQIILGLEAWWCANYLCQQRNKKKTSYNFMRFLHMSSWCMTFLRLLHRHVILINDLAKLHVVCFSKSFSQTSLAHPDFKVLDLNIHVKHIVGFSHKGEK